MLWNEQQHPPHQMSSWWWLKYCKNLFCFLFLKKQQQTKMYWFLLHLLFLFFPPARFKPVLCSPLMVSDWVELNYFNFHLQLKLGILSKTWPPLKDQIINALCSGNLWLLKHTESLTIFVFSSIAALTFLSSFSQHRPPVLPNHALPWVSSSVVPQPTFFSCLLSTLPEYYAFLYFKILKRLLLCVFTVDWGNNLSFVENS